MTTADVTPSQSAPSPQIGNRPTLFPDGIPVSWGPRSFRLLIESSSIGKEPSVRKDRATLIGNFDFGLLHLPGGGVITMLAPAEARLC